MTVVDELVVYRVDDRDQITFVGGHWAAAAAAAKTSLPADTVIGRSLWVYIRNRSLKALYQSLFAHVRDSGLPLAFPYRCDSPEARRYLRMTITPLENQHLEICSRLTEEEPRDRPLPVEAASSGEDAVPRCSVCNRFRTDGRWRDILDTVADGLVFDRDRPVRVVHSVCHDCQRSLQMLTLNN